MNPHSLPPVSEFRHKTDLQIRFSDVDVLGHVNNTVYLSFYDTGKAYFFQDIHERIIEWNNVETVIANVDCAYIHPIFFGNRVAVYSRCESIGEKSFTLLQIIADTETGTIHSACKTVMVCFDPEKKVAIDMPPHWRKALEKAVKEVKEAKEANGNR